MAPYNQYETIDAPCLILNKTGEPKSGAISGQFVLGGATIFMLADAIPVIGEMSVSGRIAVSILGGAILVARSPSSAIAVINELRARGPFVQTVLGVTVVMDVAVIVLFALNSSIAETLLTGKSFPLNKYYSIPGH